MYLSGKAQVPRVRYSLPYEAAMKTALTIGFFDGVHLGHRIILEKLRTYPHATILTFSNHPRSILNPPAPKLLLPFEEKITLLQQYADNVIALPFTLEYAKTPFDELLAQYDLSHIILGSGSAFGKNREGNEANVRAFAAKKEIHVEYIPKLYIDGKPVSSSRIRTAIADGNLNLANQLLGKI